MNTIDRREKLSYEDFSKEYLRPRRPVILVGALDEMGARRKWTPEYFKEKLGDKLVATDSGPMPVSEIVDGVKRDNGGRKVPFLRERPVPWVLPELLADLDPYPEYAAPNWLAYPFSKWADPFRRGYGAMLLRLGQIDINVTGPGVNFPFLHLDRFHCHALIMQWCGRKEFFVFDPEQTPYLYPNRQCDLSQVNDVLQPDLKRFPLFAKAKMRRFTLNPGEALFSPSGWWHTTRTVDPSIATVISFANSSNWSGIIRWMTPLGIKEKFTFAPFALYMLALGIWKLPRHRFENAARIDAAERAFDHFVRLVGASCPMNWDNSSGMQHRPGAAGLPGAAPAGGSLC